jgi:hypothetical protein
MAIRAMIHVQNEETILCEIDDMPDPKDIFIVIHNPRRRDGKPIPTIDATATSFAYPWARISFIEFFEEVSTRENIVGFFRESDTHRRHG